MTTQIARAQAEAGRGAPSAARLAAKRLRDWTVKLLIYAILMPLALAGVVPVIWMFFSSLKSVGEFNVNPWLWPHVWQWANYIRIWQGANFALYFFNSAFMTIAAVTTQILVGAMAGYALARFHFPMRKGLLYYFIAGGVVPGQVVLIPLFILIRFLGLMNTRTGLILVYTAAAQPFVVFNLQAFFRTIPLELEEAARMDGASEFRIFWQVMLPLVRSGLGTMAIFQSMWIWNEFLFALLFASKESLRTLPIGIFNIIGQYYTEYPVFFAGLMVATLPILVIYVLTVRYVIHGVRAGAVKG